MSVVSPSLSHDIAPGSTDAGCSDDNWFAEISASLVRCNLKPLTGNSDFLKARSRVKRPGKALASILVGVATGVN